MAAREGFRIDGWEFATPPSMSTDLAQYAPDVVFAPSIHDAGIPLGSDVVGRRIPAGVRMARSGGHVPSFFDDFYHRIHVVPRTVALGNVLSEQVTEVEVWNAWFVPLTLESITPHNAEGVTLTAPGDPPLDPPTGFAPLESRIYLLSAATSGPSTIDASFEWAWSTGETLTLSVTGTRVVIWPFRPNWSRGVLERIGYVTDVQASDDDTEQRSSLSGDTPRRQIEFTCTLQGDQLAAADALVWGWQSQVYGVPVWWDIARTAAPLSAGATTVACDTADREFRVGGIAILTTGDRRIVTPVSEAAEIADVQPGQLVLVRPLQRAWPAGTAVCPAVLARLPDRQVADRITAGVGELGVLFATEDEPDIAPPVPVLTYQGIEVDLRRPLRSRPVDASYARRLGRLDNGFGPVVVDDATGRPQVTRQHDYRLRTRAEQVAFRGWVRARRGQQFSQWSPTWQTELRPLATLSDTGTVLVIAAIGASSYFNGQIGRRDLLLEHRDGTQWLRQVTSVVAGAPGQENVLIDAALGVQVAPGDWKRVCWLELVCQASDWTEINHQTAEVAQAAVGLRTVRG